MNHSAAELEAIVRKRICGVCSDRTVSGECGLSEPKECALFRLFPQVAQAIQSVTSDDIHQYIEAIRQKVCSICADEAADGSCEKREEVRCSLDAYLLLVVEAIEEATGKDFDKSRLRPSGIPVGIRPNPQNAW
jgi:hypothetical protein